MTSCVHRRHTSATMHLLNVHTRTSLTANTDSKKRGVMTAIKDTVSFTLRKEVKDPLGRYWILVCDINSKTLTLVNVYAPNEHQIRFFNKLMKTIHKHQPGGLLIFGDFNISPNPAMDSSFYQCRYVASLQCSIQSHDLFDAWRCLHASEKEFHLFFSILTAPIVR